MHGDRGRRDSAPEPLVGCADEAGEVALDIFDVVELGRERVEDVYDDDLPVGLALIEEGHDTEDLNLFDLADVANLLADLADIKGIVVALGLGLSVHLGGVLPGLDGIRMRYVRNTATKRRTWGNAP